MGTVYVTTLSLKKSLTSMRYCERCRREGERGKKDNDTNGGREEPFYQEEERVIRGKVVADWEESSKSGGLDTLGDLQEGKK